MKRYVAMETKKVVAQLGCYEFTAQIVDGYVDEKSITATCCGHPTELSDEEKLDKAFDIEAALSGDDRPGLPRIL